MSASIVSWRKSYALVSVGTLAIVASADVFFYNHPLGWPAAIVTGAMLAILSMRDARFLRTNGGRIVAIALVGLLVALVEQPSRLNIAYAFICLSALSLANAGGWESDFVRWLARFARWAATGWARLFLDNGVAMRWLVRRGLSPRTARGVAAWFVPALLSGVFMALFALANPIISDWFSRLGSILGDLIARLPELLNFQRMFFWLLVASLAWMLLRGRIRRRITPADAGYTAITTALPRFWVPPAMVVRCLILFNIVFIVQNALDTRYLWSEQGLPPGMSYTEYVHRGAYPLIAAALLAATFVLITFRTGSDTERSPWARRLVYLWIAQTILLTLSAAWRLVRYVELTALTRLRVASSIWFLLVAMGLVYIIWRIVKHRSNRWLINVNALTAMIVLYPCCFINFDAMIGNFNAMHCAEAGGDGSALDVDYFRDLGFASLPALERVREQLPDATKRARATRISDELRSDLREAMSDWRGWTWRGQRTANVIHDLNVARARPNAYFAQRMQHQPPFPTPP